jgi:hypothetical protein
MHARFAGWEDKRFDVPASFLAFMLDPRRSSLGRSDLPSGFAARGGIWQQVLAGLTLSRGEREAWHTSVASSANAAQWLLCRLAAKDAVRRRLAERGLAIPPADIAIEGGLSGELHAAGAWAPAVGGAIAVTVDIVDGEPVAVCRPAASAVLAAL